jgi:hypothetical protein
MKNKKNKRKRIGGFEDTALGLLAKEREQRSRRKGYLTLEELERRVGLRKCGRL